MFAYVSGTIHTHVVFIPLIPGLDVNPTDVKRDPLPWEMTMHWCQATNTQSQALYPVRLVYGGEKENERRSNIHGNHVMIKIVW